MATNQYSSSQQSCVGPASRGKVKQLFYVAEVTVVTSWNENVVSRMNSRWKMVSAYVDMYVCSTPIWQNAA